VVGTGRARRPQRAGRQALGRGPVQQRAARRLPGRLGQEGRGRGVQAHAQQRVPAEAGLQQPRRLGAVVDARDQPVVGVEGQVHAGPPQRVDRVQGQRGRGAGVQVAGRADLQVHAQALQLGQHGRAAGRVDQLGQAHAVADALRAQARRLQHALAGIGLAGVQRQAQAGGAQLAQQRGMARGREAGLGPGEVEADHARGAGPTRPLRRAVPAQGQRGGAGDLRVGLVAQRADDQAAGQRAARQAVQQGLHRRVGRDAVGLEQQRRDAELGQHAALGTGVLGGLEGDAGQRLGRGHRRHRQREAAQVLVQRAGVGAGVEPGGQRVGVLGRRCDAALAQQVQQRGHAQAAVQVLVQQHLGHPARAPQRGGVDRRRRGGGGIGHRAMLPGGGGGRAAGAAPAPGAPGRGRPWPRSCYPAPARHSPPPP